MAAAPEPGGTSRAAEATQPNQIGQLKGSVSIGVMQPLKGGRPRPETRYQRYPSASTGTPATC